MKKTLIATSIASAFSLSALTMPSIAAAEVSANIGVVSNYYFRGGTLSDDQAAVQGGVDYAHESGFYAGTWASTLGGNDPSYELDLYAGYGGSVGDLGYDVGYVYFAYPDSTDDFDYGEVYGSLTYSYFTAGLAYTANSQADEGGYTEGDLYYYAGVDVPFGDSGYTGSLYYGYYTFDDDGDAKSDGSGVYDLDYDHWTASLSKDAGDFGSFNLNLELAEAAEDSVGGADNVDDLKVWVGWSKSF